MDIVLHYEAGKFTTKPILANFNKKDYQLIKKELNFLFTGVKNKESLVVHIKRRYQKY